MSYILFPLDTTLWQKCCTVLRFKFLATGENTETAKCDILKNCLYSKTSKNSRHFYSKTTMVYISIKYISSCADEYQIHCFCLILTYGNITTKCYVLNSFKE